jgi:serine/threonine-protein kinase
MFSSDRAGTMDLWTTRADGSAQAVLELDHNPAPLESVWSTDHEWLVYRTSETAVGAGDILARRSGLDSIPVPLVATAASELAPTLSVDGRWMAYTSNENGTDEIYVVPFPNVADGKYAVSAGGGSEPVWSRSGRELFYRNGQGELVAVQVETEPTFARGATRVLFSATEYLADRRRRQYDVSRDDERFLMLRPVGDGVEVAGKLVLVQNFSAELERVVPN